MHSIISLLIKIYYFICRFFDKKVINHEGKILPDKTNKTDNDKMYQTYDGKQKIIVIGDYNIAKNYYKERQNTIRSYPYLGYVFDKLLINSIGANSGNKWLEMKKPLSSFFTTKSVENFFELFLSECDKWISQICSDGRYIKRINELEIDKMTIKIISTIVYGKTSADDMYKLYQLSVSHNEMMFLMSNDMTLRIPFINKYFCKHGSDKVNTFWSNWVIFNKKMEDKIISGSLLDIMNKDQVYQDKTSLYQTLYEIMLFNTDIMIDSFSHLIMNIAKHDHVRNKLYNECKNVNINSYRDINELSYLSCVINESARLHPGIVLTFPETITKDLNLGGYFLPIGSVISLDTNMINRDKQIWNDPDDFNPDRFMSLEDNALLYKFHRFGLDYRKCMGNIFADYILKLAIIKLLQRFDFTLQESNNILTNRKTIANLSNYDIVGCIKFTPLT